MSDLVLREIEHSLQKPTRREWLERLRRDEPFEVPGGSAALIRVERDSR